MSFDLINQHLAQMHVSVDLNVCASPAKGGLQLDQTAGHPVGPESPRVNCELPLCSSRPPEAGDAAPTIDELLESARDDAMIVRSIIDAYFDRTTCRRCDESVPIEMRPKHIMQHINFASQAPSLDERRSLFRCHAHQLSLESLSELMTHARRDGCDCSIALHGIRFRYDGARALVQCLECNLTMRARLNGSVGYWRHAILHLKYYHERHITRLCHTHHRARTSADRNNSRCCREMVETTPDMMARRDERKREIEHKLRNDNS
jgi:hypothetical protein